jgi:hypothetical protein
MKFQTIRFRARHVAGIAALCVVASSGAAAAADRMTFYMKNQTSRSVVVELYAQDRRHAWPGGDQVYLLEKGEKKSVPVECVPGERICWGGWVYGNDRKFWGTGPGNGRACDDCCTICAPKTTETIELAD